MGYLLIILSLVFLSCSSSNNYDHNNTYTPPKNTNDEIFEAELLLKEVAEASDMYEAMHLGQQTTLDELESKGFIDVSYSLKRKWKIEISEDIFTATSTNALRSGAGIEVYFNRISGEISNNYDYYTPSKNTKVEYETYRQTIDLSELSNKKFIFKKVYDLEKKNICSGCIECYQILKKEYIINQNQLCDTVAEGTIQRW